MSLNLVFEELPNDCTRGYIRLKKGGQLYYAFVEWIEHSWYVREMTWLTQMNSKWIMKTNKSIASDELISLGNFIKTIPAPNKT